MGTNTLDIEHTVKTRRGKICAPGGPGKAGAWAQPETGYGKEKSRRMKRGAVQKYREEPAPIGSASAANVVCGNPITRNRLSKPEPVLRGQRGRSPDCLYFLTHLSLLIKFLFVENFRNELLTKNVYDAGRKRRPDDLSDPNPSSA
jgi:hypothetical protein